MGPDPPKTQEVWDRPCMGTSLHLRKWELGVRLSGFPSGHTCRIQVSAHQLLRQDVLSLGGLHGTGTVVPHQKARRAQELNSHPEAPLTEGAREGVQWPLHLGLETPGTAEPEPPHRCTC